MTLNLKRNSFYSLLGFSVPTLIILIAYPVLVHRLGKEAFGIFTLATSISGALAILDFGFSGSTLKFVAEDIAKGDKQSAADIIVASLVFYGGIGTLGGVGIWFISPWLVLFFSVSQKMQTDAVLVFRLAALQFVIFYFTTVFISVFKGLQKFHYSTVLLVVLSILTYGVAAFGVYKFHFGLIFITMVSLFSNIFVLLLSVGIALHLCDITEIPIHMARPRIKTFRRMMGFGSALALSNFAGILHAQVQRMFISSLLGPEYVTSFILGVWGPAKINGATLALSEPLFPKIASLSQRNDGKYIRSLYYRYVAILLGFSFISLCPVLFFSNKLFSIWMGADVPLFAPHIASILSIGLLFNVLSQPTYHSLNGFGKPLLNTFFAFLSPLVLYLFLGFFFLINKRLNILDFAWATSLSLMITAICYCIWFEVRILRKLQHDIDGTKY